MHIGWYLTFTDFPLITDEIYINKYGPFIPTLHENLKHYGIGPITKKIYTDDLILYKSEEWNFLCSVYKKYSSFSPAELIALTHELNSQYKLFKIEEIKQWFKIKNA